MGKYPLDHFVFSPNAGIYGPEKLQTRTPFADSWLEEAYVFSKWQTCENIRWDSYFLRKL